MTGVVVALIPFELRHTLFGLSNLQWAFVVVALLSAPPILRRWRELKDDRLVRIAAVFVFLQWAAAIYAPEFHTNAAKGAIRFTAAFVLLLIARAVTNPARIRNTWAVAAAVAALYALLDYAGLGFPSWFRTEEFYIGQVRRLSGSFEYPNTAAAYFAMSLPIVWWSSLKPAFRWTAAALVWAALILTFSKGAIVAAVAGLLVAAFFDWRKSAALAGFGATAYLLLLPVNPYLLERFRAPGMHNPIAAEYESSWNYIRQATNTRDEIRLTIRNTGISNWRARGPWRIAVSYRWLDTKSMTFEKTIPLVTSLPRTVENGETVEVIVPFRTPDRPGKYVGAFEMFGRNFDWFSRTGVIPFLVEADVATSSARQVDHIDLTHWYRMGQNAEPPLTASVSRSELWRAALKIFWSHPFGVGPDNYRLQYGKYLAAARWDTNVYSNNLFLEILSGSGILGLAAFIVLLAAIRWRPEPECYGIGIFLLHGIVDVFLMATPIYFAFWILAGSSRIQGRTGDCPNSAENH